MKSQLILPRRVSKTASFNRLPQNTCRKNHNKNTKR